MQGVSSPPLLLHYTILVLFTSNTIYYNTTCTPCSLDRFFPFTLTHVLSVDASIVTSRSSSTSFLLSPSDILPAISPPPLPATDDGISGHIRPLLMPAVNCTSIGPGVPAVPAVPGVGGMRMCGSWYCLILRMILGMGSFSMSVVDQMLVAGAAPRVDYSAFLFLCRS